MIISMRQDFGITTRQRTLEKSEEAHLIERGKTLMPDGPNQDGNIWITT